MIEIEDKIISKDLFEKKFVCDLTKMQRGVVLKAMLEHLFLNKKLLILRLIFLKLRKKCLLKKSHKKKSILLFR